MATAKRVAQEPKFEGGQRLENRKKYLVTLIDGKEQSREFLASTYHNIDSRVLVPQPDRIFLDLSLEEAKAIKVALCYSSNSKAVGVVTAISVALNAPSPKQGTPTSPAKDANTLKSPVQGKAFGEGYSPIGGGLSAVAAQRRAYEELLFGDSPFGDNGR